MNFTSLLVRSRAYCKTQRCFGNRVNRSAYQFIDKVRLEVRGGRGGNGCVSYEVLSPGRRRPDGGSGGRGGNVYLVADKSLTGLVFQTFHFNAADGSHGSSDKMTGRAGKDVYVKVPCGTLVSEMLEDEGVFGEQVEGVGGAAELDWDAHVSLGGDDDDERGRFEKEETEEWAANGDDDNDDRVDTDLDCIPSLEGYDEAAVSFSAANTVDLDTHHDMLLVAQGGAPGIGNGVMKGGAARKVRSTPTTKVPGAVGERRSLLLELKLIADVGLVGFPNAGKSTLLAALSNARPKIAPYPFTTLHPNVGVVEYSDLRRLTVADIPGLVEGAHEDRGLGHSFLRHVERTRVLLVVIDGAHVSTAGRPVDDLDALLHELNQYDASMLTKPMIVFANKSDIDLGTDGDNDRMTHLEELEHVCKELGASFLWGSAETGDGMPELARLIRLHTQEAAAAEAASSTPLD